MISLLSNDEKRSIKKVSTLKDSVVDFQHVFLFFLKKKDNIYANKIYY